MSTGTGTVTITNVGDADGDFTLTASNLVDTPPTPPFSSVLTLVDQRRRRDEVYNGPLGRSRPSTSAPGRPTSSTLTRSR